MKRNLRITLLLSFIVLVNFDFNTQAQGWTFSFQRSQPGPCGANAAIDLIPSLPDFGFANQGQCASARQTVLAGTTTYNDSFSDTFTRLNDQSQKLLVKSSVTDAGPRRNIDRTGQVTINRSSMTAANLCGNGVRW